MLGRTSESPRSDFAGPKASQQRLRRAASGPCRKAATGKVGRFRLPVPQGSEAALSCLGLDFRLSPGEASPRRAATSTIRRACSRRRDPSRQCRECDGLPPLRVGECPYPRPSRRAPAHPFPSRAATSGSFVVAGACRTGSARKYLSCKEVVPAKLLHGLRAWGKPDQSPGPQGGRRATEELCKGAWMGPSFGGWDRQGGGRGSCAGWDCALAQRLAQMLAEGSDAWMRTPAFWAVPG